MSCYSMLMTDNISKRLDAQAKALKDLNTRVKALEAMLASSTTPVAPALGSPGVYVHNPDCVLCGKPKVAGSTTLTCKPCGTKRQQQINTKTLAVVSECKNCGASKGGTQLLCRPCSKSKREQSATA